MGVPSKAGTAICASSRLERLSDVANTDGSRRIINISEITGMESTIVTMQDLFVFDRRGVDTEGKILGSLVPTGIRPHHLEKFTAAGIDLPIAMFARAR